MTKAVKLQVAAEINGMANRLKVAELSKGDDLINYQKVRGIDDTLLLNLESELRRNFLASVR